VRKRFTKRALQKAERFHLITYFRSILWKHYVYDLIGRSKTENIDRLFKSCQKT